VQDDGLAPEEELGLAPAIENSFRRDFDASPSSNRANLRLQGEPVGVPELGLATVPGGGLLHCQH